MPYDLSDLTSSQLELVVSIIEQFKLPHEFTRKANSEWMTAEVSQRLGDALRFHHAFSRQALSKDRFEYAFERALNLSGIAASLEESRTNRGHDISVAGVPVNLKTEAAANIKEDTIHVSKWMELGRGEWDLAQLLDKFLKHMENYHRIFTLRCILRRPARHPTRFRYELVEIPKALLLKAANCHLETRTESRQNPQPGYGYVKNDMGELEFALYFDGGTERKLQIKDLRKDLCIVHATWAFQSTAL